MVSACAHVIIIDQSLHGSLRWARRDQCLPCSRKVKTDLCDPSCTIKNSIHNPLHRCVHYWEYLLNNPSSSLGDGRGDSAYANINVLYL
jgi:hypothetical protein